MIGRILALVSILWITFGVLTASTTNKSADILMWPWVWFSVIEKAVLVRANELRVGGGD